MRWKLNLLDTSDIDEFIIVNGILGGAVLHNRPLIEDRCCGHFQWLEELIHHKVLVALTAGFLNYHAK